MCEVSECVCVGVVEGGDVCGRCGKRGNVGMRGARVVCWSVLVCVCVSCQRACPFVRCRFSLCVFFLACVVEVECSQ